MAGIVFLLTLLCSATTLIALACDPVVKKENKEAHRLFTGVMGFFTVWAFALYILVTLS